MKKYMNMFIGFVVLVIWCFMSGLSYGQQIKHSFTKTDVPQNGIVYLKGVNFKTTQNIDITLPSNLKYMLGDVILRSVLGTTPSAGAVVSISEVTSAGAAVQTLVPSKTLNLATTGDTEELTPVPASAGIAGFAYLINPEAATAAGAFVTVTNLTAVTNVTIAAGAIDDPNTPRNVVFVITEDGATGTNLAGRVIVTGTDQAGYSVSETLTMATTTTETLTGSVAFATIASVQYMITNGAAADTLAMGYGVKLALPVDNHKQRLVSVSRLSITGVVEAATATGTTYGTFTSTTAPNAVHDYDVFYKVSGPARPDAISGANRIRVAITGSTATNDTKDVIMQLYAY